MYTASQSAAIKRQTREEKEAGKRLQIFQEASRTGVMPKAKLSRKERMKRWCRRLGQRRPGLAIDENGQPSSSYGKDSGSRTAEFKPGKEMPTSTGEAHVTSAVSGKENEPRSKWTKTKSYLGRVLKFKAIAPPNPGNHVLSPSATEVNGSEYPPEVVPDLPVHVPQEDTGEVSTEGRTDPNSQHSTLIQSDHSQSSNLTLSPEASKAPSPTQPSGYSTMANTRPTTIQGNSSGWDIIDHTVPTTAAGSSIDLELANADTSQMIRNSSWGRLFPKVPSAPPRIDTHNPVRDPGSVVWEDGQDEISQIPLPEDGGPAADAS